MKMIIFLILLFPLLSLQREKRFVETPHVLFAGNEREQREQGRILLSVPDWGGGQGEAHLWTLQWRLL